MEHCPQPDLKKRRTSTTRWISWLPHEIVAEVLSRLPAKSLQKFRCVCKDWNYVIANDGYLVARHLRNRDDGGDGMVSLFCIRRFFKNAPGPMDRYAYYSNPTLTYSAAGDDDDGDCSGTTFKLDLHRIEKQHRRHYWITNSCDGLVGVFSFCSVFYIANPSIRKLTALPGEYPHLDRYESDVPEAGIGFDASTGEYKAVRLFQYRSRARTYEHTGCEVYTLGGASSRGWKLVGNAPFQPYRRRMPEGYASCPPVVVAGAIHWTVLRQDERGPKPEIALSFNLSGEKFGVIVHPKGSSRPLLSRVAALGGRLCVADTSYSSHRMDIWVLEDYSNRRWAKQYSIRLLDMYRSTEQSALMTLPVTIRSDGTVVLFDRGSRRSYYDPRTGKFIVDENIKDGRVGIEQLVSYTDSLVWPWPTGIDCKEKSQVYKGLSLGSIDRKSSKREFGLSFLFS